jgi:hypothetical protein
LKKGFWIVVALLMAVKGMGQTIRLDSAASKGVVMTDSLLKKMADTLTQNHGKKKFMPVPRKSSLYALIPGGGQVYNREYWKVAFVWAAIGGGVYVRQYWQVRYKDFLRNYEKFYDLNTGKPINSSPDYKIGVRYRGGWLNGDSVESVELTVDQVKRIKNSYKRYSGLSFIATGLIYTVSIIEANVAAHLKTFDLSEDLALRIEPKFSQPLMRQPTAQVRLVFNFK